MSNFIIGQIISTAALVVSVLIAQFKNVKYILIGEIAANLLVAFSFLFLGGMSGAWICIVAAVQAIIIFYANEKNIEQRIRNILTLIFAAVYIIGTIAVYQNPDGVDEDYQIDETSLTAYGANRLYLERWVAGSSYRRSSSYLPFIHCSI